MKVENSNPFAPAAPSRRAEPVKKASAAKSAAKAARTPDGVTAVAPIAATDTVERDFLGIPKEEMTPKVQAAITTLLAEVDTLRKEVESANARLIELERLADTDSLAPVANRRAFVRELSKFISYAQRYGVPASLIYFDINDLKTVNDRLGHTAGDQVIEHVANSLLINLRASDVVGRLGGDEFAALLMQANEAQALEKGAQLADLISETPLKIKGETIRVSVAFGAHTFDRGEDPTAILDQADQRMYANKKALKSAVKSD